jgi:hypothetical protein
LPTIVKLEAYFPKGQDGSNLSIIPSQLQSQVLKVGFFPRIHPFLNRIGNNFSRQQIFLEPEFISEIMRFSLYLCSAMIKFALKILYLMGQLAPLMNCVINLPVQFIHISDHINLFNSEYLYIFADLFKVSEDGGSILQHLIDAHGRGFNVDVASSFGDDNHILLALQEEKLLLDPLFFVFALFKLFFQLNVDVLFFFELGFQRLVDHFCDVPVVGGAEFRLQLSYKLDLVNQLLRQLSLLLVHCI